MLLTDRQLAKAITAGKAKAFETFVDRYGAQVHSLVKRYVDRSIDAEDITQEIFTLIFKSVGSWRGESSLNTWVYRVARNRCLRYLEQRKPESLSLEDRQDLADLLHDPETEAVRAELQQKVRCAVSGLSPLHRDVVELHEMQGLTYTECAELLDVPVGTVKSRLSNAFRQLRTNLKSYINEESFTPALATERRRP